MISISSDIWLQIVDGISELSDNGRSPPQTEVVVVEFVVRTSNNGVGVVSNQPLVQQSSGGKSSLRDSRVGGFFVPRFDVSSNASRDWVGVVSSSSEGYSLVVQSSNEVVGDGAVVGEEEEVIISSGGDGEGPAGITNIVRGGRAGVISSVRSVPNWGKRVGNSVEFGSIGMDGKDSVGSGISGGDDDGVDSLREPFQDGKMRSSSAGESERSNTNAWGSRDKSSVVDLDLSSNDTALFEEGGDVIEGIFSGVDGELLVSSGGGSSGTSTSQGINVICSWGWVGKRCIG